MVKDTELCSEVHDIIRNGDAVRLSSVIVGDPDIVHLRSTDGKGPLFWAYEHNRGIIVSLLLNAGVDTEVTDSAGNRPIDYAPLDFVPYETDETFASVDVGNELDTAEAGGKLLENLTVDSATGLDLAFSFEKDDLLIDEEVAHVADQNLLEDGLTTEEVASRLLKVLQTKVHLIRRVFTKLQIEGNPQIDREDFVTGIQKILKLSRGHAEELFLMFDSDGNGNIDYPEFINGLYDSLKCKDEKGILEIANKKMEYIKAEANAAMARKKQLRKTLQSIEHELTQNVDLSDSRRYLLMQKKLLVMEKIQQTEERAKATGSLQLTVEEKRVLRGFNALQTVNTRVAVPPKKAQVNIKSNAAVVLDSAKAKEQEAKEQHAAKLSKIKSFRKSLQQINTEISDVDTFLREPLSTTTHYALLEKKANLMEKQNDLRAQLKEIKQLQVVELSTDETTALRALRALVSLQRTDDKGTDIIAKRKDAVNLIRTVQTAAGDLELREKLKEIVKDANIDSMESMAVKTSIVQLIPCFVPLIDDNQFVNDVASFVEVRTYKAGQRVVEEGTIGKEMFFIVVGKVDVCKSGQTFATLGIGDFFGEIALLNPTTCRTADVVATDDTMIFTLSQTSFNQISKLYPKALVAVTASAQIRLRKLGKESSVSRPEEIEIERDRLIARLRVTLATKVDKLRSFFDRYDMDNDGELDKAEFTVMMLDFGLDALSIEALWDIYDSDKSGFVSKVEVHNQDAYLRDAQNLMLASAKARQSEIQRKAAVVTAQEKDVKQKIKLANARVQELNMLLGSASDTEKLQLLKEKLELTENLEKLNENLDRISNSRNSIEQLTPAEVALIRGEDALQKEKDRIERNQDEALQKRRKTRSVSMVNIKELHSKIKSTERDSMMQTIRIEDVQRSIHEQRSLLDSISVRISQATSDADQLALLEEQIKVMDELRILEEKLGEYKKTVGVALSNEEKTALRSYSALKSLKEKTRKEDDFMADFEKRYEAMKILRDDTTQRIKAAKANAVLKVIPTKVISNQKIDDVGHIDGFELLTPTHVSKESWSSHTEKLVSLVPSLGVLSAADSACVEMLSQRLSVRIVEKGESVVTKGEKGRYVSSGPVMISQVHVLRCERSSGCLHWHSSF